MGIYVLSRRIECFCHPLPYHTPLQSGIHPLWVCWGIHCIISRGVGGLVYLPRSMARLCALTWNLVIAFLCCIGSNSNMKVIHEYLPPLDPILWRMGAKNVSDMDFELKGHSRSNPVVRLNSPYMISY